ncbi:hypothetical protein EMIT0P253_10555 [Pseudomonas sp. IT-P253]
MVQEVGQGMLERVIEKRLVSSPGTQYR